jgi:hypothetical protein
MTLYEFVGQKDLLTQVKSELKGTCIDSILDIENWIIKTKQRPDFNSEIIVTFVIDLNFKLLINDRHSEHVVCANGEPVLAAGEITFELSKIKALRISQITNQSINWLLPLTSFLGSHKINSRQNWHRVSKIFYYNIYF